MSITIATARRIRDRTGTDILDLSTGGAFERLWTDIILVGEVLHAACLTEVEQRGLSQDEFLAGLAGDSADGARRALMDEIVSFTPDPRLRDALTRVVEEARGQMEREIGRIWRTTETSGASSGDAQASSESTPIR